VNAQAAAERQLDRRIAGLVAEAKRQAEAAARARRQQQQQRTGGGSGGGTTGGGGSGIFMWPATGIVTQEFGCTGFPLEPPRGSCSHFHDGIDIANGSGTPVRAPGDGVVAFVGWNPYDGGGDPSFMIVIGHAGGLTTRYMHLQGRSVVHAGQSVRRGQLIGYMGNTGNSTGTHLHWEVYRGDTPINPRSFV
jgi:murein DD-endopeptidase MepM/ murein hydrolase activator NlpD